MTSDSRCHQHLNLLAGIGTAGQPVHEQVPAAQVAGGRYRLEATPALVDGCAAGDLVEIDHAGRVSVIERGGNLAVQSFSEHDAFDVDQVETLREAWAVEGGLVEAPPHLRFVVVTVPARIGFPRIEAITNRWSETTGSGWSFGNVFDKEGTPLNWW
ncbi:DUF4265 domain-containing protein [Actinomadura oligospora]|uniref:DUF4265 domain-containing protein n=1 Tax=Actinomadura oligospora TaxID=111804 RepID=UPI001474C05D|nr:DUF4265 domain-containing protein [Actinomadura oligospora]